MKNLTKWLLIRKGSKVVTVGNDPINDIQNVVLIKHGRIYTKEWNYKVAYSYDDVRLATRKEVKQGFREKV